MKAIQKQFMLDKSVGMVLVLSGKPYKSQCLPEDIAHGEFLLLREAIMQALKNALTHRKKAIEYSGIYPSQKTTIISLIRECSTRVDRLDRILSVEGLYEEMVLNIRPRLDKVAPRETSKNYSLWQTLILNIYDLLEEILIPDDFLSQAGF